MDKNTCQCRKDFRLTELLLSILEHSDEFRDNFIDICEYMKSQNIFKESIIDKYNKIQPKKRALWYDKLKNFTPHKDLIDFGAYGIVYKTKNGLDQKTYAVKMISDKTSSNRGSLSKKYSYDKEIREIKILSQLKHKNIVRYFHSWRGMSPNINTNNSSEYDSQELVLYHSQCTKTIEDTIFISNTYKPYIFLQMEYCSKTLKDWIFNRVYPPTEKEIIFQLMEGIGYLHRKGIAHRDLKIRNIFLNGCKVKIGDFGHAKKTSQVKYFQKDIEDLTVIMLEIIYPMKTYMERAKILTKFKNGIIPPDLKLCIEQTKMLTN